MTALRTEWWAVSARGVVEPWLLEGDRYSPNLRKWMIRHNRIAKTCPSAQNRVYRRDDELWIGWIDDGLWFIGSRLWQVLGQGVRACHGCWAFSSGELTELPTFWGDYARIGRCAIDTGHKHYFIGAERRWTEGGDLRSCNWCGAHQSRRRWTETVERERWEQDSPIAAALLAAPPIIQEPI